MIIDNIELDESNIEFNYAAEFVKNTNNLVYLTGKAGTGKTTFLKYLRATTTKNAVTVAPTGVAAINAGGQTIHSFFQIKPSVYVPNDKRLRTVADTVDLDKSTIYDQFRYIKEKLEIIRGLELLIIDEISMVRCDLLDTVDRLLRVFRGRRNEPFGGVQVVLIGDTFQLPPIADFEQWDILQKHYESPFFFSSKVIQQNTPIYIELKKIYRQNEQEFIDLLNKIRVNQINSRDLALLNSKFNPTFSPKNEDNYITLATHNKIVDSTNLTKLTELKSELKIFEASISGTFPDNIHPTDKTLQIKEGAQIMFIKNDKAKKYYNGKIAKINKIEDSTILAEFSDGSEITVERQEWHNIKYTWDEKNKRIEEEVIGTFVQFPIKLAWAITVHKSQGLTFEKVIADLGSAFTSGQVYVALSRCTSFNGLVLKSIIPQNAIKTDPEVLKFAQNETPNTLIVQELNSGKANSYYQKTRDAIKILDFSDAYDNLIKAIKIRNDFETDAFKRYFVSTASKLGLYKKKHGESLIESEARTKELYNKIDSLNKDKVKLENKVSELNKGLILMDKKLKEAEYLYNDKTTRTISNQEKILEQIIYEKNKTVQIQEFKIKKLEEDIEKVKSQKWYQKIFGKH
jgi:hypothetical protein